MIAIHLNTEETPVPENLNNPFTKDSVQHIHMHVGKNTFMGNTRIYHTGTVKFKNGTTKGEQSFTAENLPDLLNQIDAFLKYLPC